MAHRCRHVLSKSNSLSSKRTVLKYIKSFVQSDLSELLDFRTNKKGEITRTATNWQPTLPVCKGQRRGGPSPRAAAVPVRLPLAMIIYVYSSRYFYSSHVQFNCFTIEKRNKG